MFLSVEFLFFVGQNDALLIKVRFRHVNRRGIYASSPIWIDYFSISFMAINMQKADHISVVSLVILAEFIGIILQLG